MSKPKHEPEVIRVRVARFIEELRDCLTTMGWGPEEFRRLSWGAEKKALNLALWPQDDLGGA